MLDLDEMSWTQGYEHAIPILEDAEAARLAAARDVLTDWPDDDDGATGALRCLVGEGFLMDTVPAKYGGRDASLSYAARFLEMLGTKNGSLGWLFTIQQGLHLLLPTATHGSCEPYFEDVRKTGALFAGSHSRSGLAMSETADGIELDGVLQYCSGAPLATWLTCTAQVPIAGTVKGCTMMIDARQAGISCEPAAHLHSMRGSLTGVVRLTKVQVPWRQVYWFSDLGDPTNRPPSCRYYGAWQSILLQGAVFLGIAGCALAYAREQLVRKRASTDPAKRLAGDLGMGQSAAEFLQARSIFYHRVEGLELAASTRTEQREASRPSHAALLGSVASLTYSCVSRLVELLGGSVLVSGNPLERCWRDIQLARVAEGARQPASNLSLGAFILDQKQ
ncbi:acyl-CoA dehydrogenase family protein [Kribbella speibonae]|uniref:Acyl-CoA dehydrogenase n=1 Tax=Kribbella speibonae TaxID=1572660 RepID=A0A4R0IUW1_9ACTN|nr:acyl-CoA dehydrogenase family protein [Kribbella speibonae]TCC36314.1 acyl-CoA dehydrogenase [Kribbella speibonae]